MMHAQVALAASILVLLLVGAPTVAADEELILIDSFAVWTLEDLGSDDLVVPVDRPNTEVSIRYALPPTASQGPDEWYMIHLHLEMEIAEESGDGFAIVSALTNGWASAQIQFTVEAEADSFRMTWDSVDLLNGYKEEVTASRATEMRFSNYLPFAGVRPGENVLTFKLEQFQDVKVSRLRVLRDSGLEYTPLSPPRLELEPTLPDGRVRAGDVFEIGYALSNVGDRPAKDVVVGVIYPPEGFTLLGETPHAYPSIVGGVEGVFRLKAIAEGTHRIVLGAESPSSRPVAEIQTVVYPPNGTWLTRERLWPAAALVFVSLLVVAVVGRSLADRSRLRGGR